MTLRHTWKTSDGSILAHRSGSPADTLAGLDTGTYFVQVTGSACDTTLVSTIIALPKPEVHAWPADTTIRYVDSIRLHTAGALL